VGSLRACGAYSTAAARSGFCQSYLAATLWAEWQAGHQLRTAGRGKRGPKVNSQPAKQLTGFLSLIESHDLKKDNAYRWIAMSFAPRETVEKSTAKRARKTLNPPRTLPRAPPKHSHPP